MRAVQGVDPVRTNGTSAFEEQGIVNRSSSNTRRYTTIHRGPMECRPRGDDLEPCKDVLRNDGRGLRRRDPRLNRNRSQGREAFGDAVSRAETLNDPTRRLFQDLAGLDEMRMRLDGTRHKD